MSDQNVEIVRRVFEAYASGDGDAVVEMFGPDAVIVSSFLVGRRVMQGRDGVQTFLQVLKEEWDRFSLDAEEFRDLGDSVLALGRVVAERRGGSFSGEAGWLFALREGKIRRLEAYIDHEAALEAAGLPK